MRRPEGFNKFGFNPPPVQVKTLDGILLDFLGNLGPFLVVDFVVYHYSLLHSLEDFRYCGE